MCTWCYQIYSIRYPQDEMAALCRPTLTNVRCYNSPVEARNPRPPRVERESTGEAERRNTPTGKLQQDKNNINTTQLVLKHTASVGKGKQGWRKGSVSNVFPRAFPIPLISMSISPSLQSNPHSSCLTVTNKTSWTCSNVNRFLTSCDTRCNYFENENLSS